MNYRLGRDWSIQHHDGGGADAGAAAAAAAAASAAAAAAAAKPWYTTAGADAEAIGHWQNLGLAEKTPAEVAIAMTKAHREAQKFIGIPADQIARIPKADAPEADQAAFWQRLGAGKEAKDYDFANVKDAAGNPIDPALADKLRAAALASRTPKAQAEALAKAVLDHTSAAGIETAAQRAAALLTEQTALKTNWGANYDANMVVAKAAAAALGVTPEIVAKLEEQVGYSKVMDMFRNIGSKIGEDKFVLSPTGTGKLMTKEGAVAERKNLMNDQAFRERILAGDTAATRQMRELNVLITGGDDTELSRTA